MTRRHRLGSTTSIALSVALSGALTLAACGLPTKTPADAARPSSNGAVATNHRIAQLEFGRIARLASCVEPACPSITPKTLAAAAPPVPAAPVAIAAVPPIPAQIVESKLTVAVVPPPEPHKLVLHFGTDSAALTPSHKSMLGNALADLRKTDRLVIVGRTDNLGSEARNQSLALARALAIRDHLLDLAPDLPARIAIDAKGRCCYAVPNGSPEGRAQNRRVELIFTLPLLVKS